MFSVHSYWKWTESYSTGRPDYHVTFMNGFQGWVFLKGQEEEKLVRDSEDLRWKLKRGTEPLKETRAKKELGDGTYVFAGSRDAYNPEYEWEQLPNGNWVRKTNQQFGTHKASTEWSKSISPFIISDPFSTHPK